VALNEAQKTEGRRKSGYGKALLPFQTKKKKREKKKRKGRSGIYSRTGKQRDINHDEKKDKARKVAQISLIPSNDKI